MSTTPVYIICSPRPLVGQTLLARIQRGWRIFRRVVEVRCDGLRVQEPAPVVLLAAGRIGEHLVGFREVGHPAVRFVLRAREAIGVIPLRQRLVCRTNDDVLGCRVDTKNRVIVQAWTSQRPGALAVPRGSMHALGGRRLRSSFTPA